VTGERKLKEPVLVRDVDGIAIQKEAVMPKLLLTAVLLMVIRVEEAISH